MIIRSLTSTLIRSFNKLHLQLRLFSSLQPQESFFSQKMIIPSEILPKEVLEIKETDQKITLFNDPNEGEIYEMAYKKTERAKRKRRKRKNGSKITLRWR